MKVEQIISCRVCGIYDWINCGCYYLYGGRGGLGDMRANIYHCDNCGWVAECCPDCPLKVQA